MDTLLCGSSMFFVSLLSLAFLAASVGGLGLLLASAFRRTNRQPASG